jgi:hypothetical protein
MARYKLGSEEHLEVKCPHCKVEFHDQRRVVDVGSDADGPSAIAKRRCSACNRDIVYLDRLENTGAPDSVVESTLLWPKKSARPPAPPEVPAQYAEDYNETSLVLADSPKASAALGRRCLQNILREKAGVKHSSLANEIQEVLDKNLLPSYLADDLDAIRNIGNFAAHPIKSQTTGAVLPVEPGEAEWNLDVIAALFDFYFVGPAKAQARRAALNQKLKDANKPPMKSRTP